MHASFASARRMGVGLARGYALNEFQHNMAYDKEWCNRCEVLVLAYMNTLLARMAL